jgi:tRNA(Ile)-lysidine synthase
VCALQALPYYNPVREKVLQYIREKDLLRAGNRVAVAVSGGADSVALLRVLLDLKEELGIVLSGVHFNHHLRADESDADEAFVAELAKEVRLEIFVGHGDVREHASTSKLSIEAAARELRYRWFAELAGEQRLDAIATAHTLDDQAETVLLKFLRGAGTRGLAGIYPLVRLGAAGAKAPISNRGLIGAPEGAPLHQQVQAAAGARLHERARAAAADAPILSGSPPGEIIRPLLSVSRQELEAYLASIGQTWREDESNLDPRFLRNRVRHDLLPLLEREFNPNIRAALSDLAEISRGEEEFWGELVDREVRERAGSQNQPADVSTTPKVGAWLDVSGFARLPVALQRRFLKRFAEGQQLTLDFEHVERLRQCALGETTKVELPGGIVASVAGSRLNLGQSEASPSSSYRCILPVPGEVRIPEAGLRLRAYVVAPEFAQEADPGSLLSLDLVGSQVTIRNWSAGDRFWPAHTRSEEKLKRLFLEKKIPAADRPSWPVALCEDRIVWVRGFPVASTHEWRGTGEALQIEVLDG